MENFTTISGRKLKVSANKTARTFTIRTDAGKFRSIKLSKEEFNSNRYNTGNDWQHFLSAGDFYKV
jgi:hypothetical protein